MQSGRKRHRYSAPPRGYSRAQAQRRGRARARGRRFTRGYDRTGGYYGRFAGPNAEMKFHDLDIDDAVIASGGTIAQVTCVQIAEGNGESERIGRKLTVKRINWRYMITMPEQDAVADPAAPDSIRVILYLDKQANGATAAVLDIVETADFQTFNNLSNKSRFRILCDKKYELNYLTLSSDGAGVSSSNSTFLNDTFYKKCNIPIEYDNSATTGVITSIRSNNIGVLLLGASNIAGFQSKMRIRYSDQ